MNKLFAVAICILVGGCAQGLLGGTQTFTVAPTEFAGAPAPKPLQIAAIEVADDANMVKATGTFALGRLEADDIEILTTSFSNTLAALGPASGPPHRIHVLFRKYIVAHSNNNGGVVAVVAWALTGPKGELEFSEQFYASAEATALGGDDIKGIPTLGKVRDVVNEAIVRRIIARSLGQSTSVPHAFETLEAASEALPKKLGSLMGLPPIAYRSVDWSVAEPSNKIDWSVRLAGK